MSWRYVLLLFCLTFSLVSASSVSAYQNIIGGQAATLPAASAARYTSLYGSANFTTETSARDRVGLNGTFYNLRAYYTGTLGAAETVVVTLRKTSANTTLTCTLTNASTSCSDLAHTATVKESDGDYVNYSLVSTFSASPTIRVYTSINFDSTGANQVFFSASAPNVNLDNATTQQYFGGINGGHSSPFPDDQSGVVQVMPVSGTVSNFDFELSGSPDNGGGTQSYFAGFSGSAIGCTIDEAATSCSDDSNTFHVNAGDTVYFSILPLNTPTVRAVKGLSAVFTPDTPGEFPIAMAKSIPNASSNAYFPVSSETSTTSNVTEARFQQITDAFTVRTMYSNGGISDNGGGTQSYTFSLRQNGSTVAGASCGVSEIVESCSATGLSIPISAGSLLATLSAPSGTPAAYVRSVSYGAYRAPACRAVVTGNWSSATTWVNCADSTPTSSDDVEILTGRTVTLDTSATVASLTIESGATLTEDGSSRTLTVTGGWSNSGTFTANTSTVKFTASQTITGGSTFNNLTFEPGSAATFTVASGTYATTTGTLTLAGSSNITLNTGNLDAKGDVTITNTGTGGGGTATLSILGTGTQTLTGSGTAGQGRLPNLIINSTGTLNLASTISLAGNFTYTAGTVAAGTSVVDFYGTKTIDGQGGSGTMAFYDCVFAGVSTLAGALDCDHDLTIASGATLDTGSGGNYAITLGRNWNNGGTFAAQAGTVTLDGGDQTLSGATTFNNLIKIAAAARTLTFPAGLTQTIAGTLTLQGASGALLALVSSSPSTAWLIDPQATRTIDYLSVTDSINSNAAAIDCAAHNCTDGGRNTNWTFPAAPAPEPAATPGASPSSSGGSGYVQTQSFPAVYTPVIAPLSFPPLITPLTLGQTSPAVIQLQQMLKQDGVYSGPITGYYGPLTKAGVARFQLKYGIPTTSLTSGLAGPVTRAKLNSLYGLNSFAQILELLKRLFAE